MELPDALATLLQLPALTALHLVALPNVSGPMASSGQLAELVVDNCPAISGPLPPEWSTEGAMPNLTRLDLAWNASVAHVA